MNIKASVSAIVGLRFNFVQRFHPALDAAKALMEPYRFTD
jgi:hypothetical protein